MTIDQEDEWEKDLSKAVVKCSMSAETPESKEPKFPGNGTIVYWNVSLRYRENLPLVFDRLSFIIPGSSKIGIVGRTGSGKSTVLLSLLRLVEIEKDDVGMISIDGYNIQDVGLHALRRDAISTIPQEATLFEGTVRFNVDPFNLRSDEEVWMALEKVGMKDHVKNVVCREDSWCECVWMD
jgi:ABC-type multidrug transport system fused ATPase/permease subunit